jgi:hypothetical protein
MTANWTINDYLDPCNLPQNLASAFPGLVEPLIDIGYTPVLYCGYQCVNGINYMLICKRVTLAPCFSSTLVKCIIHESLPVHGLSHYHILSIEDLMAIH